MESDEGVRGSAALLPLCKVKAVLPAPRLGVLGKKGESWEARRQPGARMVATLCDSDEGREAHARLNSSVGATSCEDTSVGRETGGAGKIKF